MRSRATRVLLAAAAVVAASLAVPATADEVPAGYAYSDAWFDSSDGTQLHAGVFLPEDLRQGERLPVILTSTPYTSPNGGVTALGNTSGPVIRFPELFEHPRFQAGRYAYVQVDVRGFGGSGGCFGYYLPPEVADIKVAVEWAAAAPWSKGKVGLWGKSYDAAQEVLALAAKPKGLAAAVIQAPGLSAYTALWMGGVHYATGRYATTAIYTADDLGPAQSPEYVGSPEYAAATVDGLAADPTCRTDALVRMNTEGVRDSAFWQGKEPYLGAKGSTVPVFWSHGFADANTKPVHLDVWSSLKGPKQAWFGQFTHVRGHEAAVGREGFLDESFRWLDRHVRGLKVASDPAVTVQSGNGEGRWRTEAAWPPADVRSWTMPVRAGSYDDVPGNNGDGPQAGLGHWSVTPVLAHDAHLAGETRVAAKVTTLLPGAHVIAHVYDIAPDGMATLVTRGAHAVTGTGAQSASFPTYPQDWVFEQGHRIGIHLSAADTDWFAPPTTGATVEVTGGTTTLPLLKVARTRFVEGDASDGMDSTPFAVSDATLQEATVGGQPPKQTRR
ncbi:MAG: CocE/NonD family hydrolase [Mycobacteriales bacterium]|nr:CocE/NonD family hydrolase [Mycobacteriales bacterium]